MRVSSFGRSSNRSTGKSIDVNGRESSRNGKDRSDTICIEARFSNEWQVVIELEWIASTGFLIHEEAPIASTENRVGH